MYHDQVKIFKLSHCTLYNVEILLKYTPTRWFFLRIRFDMIVRSPDAGPLIWCFFSACFHECIYNVSLVLLFRVLNLSYHFNIVSWRNNKLWNWKKVIRIMEERMKRAVHWNDFSIVCVNITTFFDIIICQFCQMNRSYKKSMGFLAKNQKFIGRIEEKKTHESLICFRV